ncbi:hypothetical protein TIFTF001_004779 [Ficus carica]|uniref:Uncharacterized protein n=1 Tax=Ficus carica TaxID=3494 RepID=A0AA87ZKE5_FICCA|nr:hypothetical protein TIFTF001_004779 [Ficus carica]
MMMMMIVDARNGSGSNTHCERVFPAGLAARGDPAGSATLGTRWVRRPVGAAGLIDGRHMALGPGDDLTGDRSRWVASVAGLSGTRSPEYSASTGKASRSARRKGLREHTKPRRRHASLTSQGRCKDALFRVSAGRKGSVINSPRYIPRDRVLGAQSGPSTRGHPGETVRFGRVPVFTENGVWSAVFRSRHQHKPPSISGLTWPGMLRVLGMQVIGLLVWSFDARHLLSPSGCSQFIGYGRVLGEVCAWSWDLTLHGTLLRAPGTSEVLGLLRQIMGPARAPPFGQYPVMGPDSVVREPQELSIMADVGLSAMADVGSCSGQMLGSARAPPFGQYSVMGPDSMVREPQELSARADVGLSAMADVGSCSGTSFRSMLGPARAPPFGQYLVMGPDSMVREPQELSARADVGLSARADVGSCSGTSF